MDSVSNNDTANMDARIIAVLVGVVLSLVHSGPLQSNHIKTNMRFYNKNKMKGLIFKTDNKKYLRSNSRKSDNVDTQNVDSVGDGERGETDNSSNEDIRDYIPTTEDPCLKRNSSGTTESQSRSVRVGDTFTPQELLQITIRLIKKVEYPGRGYGFVSSEKSARTLADKLFAAFFQTRRRIVILKEVHIPGLDALQALALSGSSANLRDINYSIESPKSEGDAFSYETPTNYTRLSSQYKLLIKNNNGDKITKKDNIKRRRIKLNKKFGRNRKFAVNRSQRNKHDGKIKERSKNNDRLRSASKFTCRWRYQCTNRTDQSSCHIHPDCTNNPYNTYIGAAHQDTKMRSSNQKVSLAPVDEEVMEIIQRHLLSVRPTIVNDIQSESIGQYFNRLIQNGGRPIRIKSGMKAVGSNGSKQVKKLSFSQDLTDYIYESNRDPSVHAPTPGDSYSRYYYDYDEQANISQFSDADTNSAKNEATPHKSENYGAPTTTDSYSRYYYDYDEEANISQYSDSDKNSAKNELKPHKSENYGAPTTTDSYSRYYYDYDEEANISQFSDSDKNSAKNELKPSESDFDTKSAKNKPKPSKDDADINSDKNKSKSAENYPDTDSEFSGPKTFTFDRNFTVRMKQLLDVKDSDATQPMSPRTQEKHA